MLFRTLQAAQIAWQRGDDVEFESIVRTPSENSEMFLALAARLYTQRGRSNWDLSDLQKGKQYALQCLWTDFHFRTLVAANQGLVNAQSVKALDINNPTLVECGRWLTISWTLAIHKRDLQGVQSDVETVKKLGVWLNTISSMQDDPWTQYATLLTLSVGEVDWPELRNAFDEIGDFDSLIQFEKNMMYTRFTDRQEFCEFPVEGIKLSENHREYWENQQYLCD